MANESLTVVIPAFNEEDTLTACVEALVRQGSTIGDIAIFDNASTDRTGQVAKELSDRFSKVTVHFQPIAGLIPTRNAALDYAETDVIARVDADMVVADGWAQAIIDCFATAPSAVAAITGPIGFHDGPWVKGMDSILEKFAPELNADGYAPVSLVNGGSMAIRRNAWQKARDHVGEGRLAEDLDLSLTLQDLGYDLAYVRAMRATTSDRRMATNPLSHARYVAQVPRTIARRRGFRGEFAKSVAGVIAWQIIQTFLWLPSRAYDEQKQKFTARSLVKRSSQRKAA